MVMYFLCSLAGDDYGIIKNLPRRLKYRFYTIGLLVGLIALISLTSYALLFSHLTEMGPGVFVITLFLTWMLANMYILVIFTLSKQVLPCNSSRGNIFGNLFKYFFLASIGVFVGIPFSMQYHEDVMKIEIAKFKKEQLNLYDQNLEKMYAHQLIAIHEHTSWLESKQNSTEQDSLVQLRAKVIEIEAKKETLHKTMISLMNRSEFYTRGVIIMLTKYQTSRFIIVLFIALFMLPAILKHFLEEKSAYYKYRRNIETKIVDEDYHQFKLRYKEIIMKLTGAPTEWEEFYIDPPYNTQKLKKPEINLKSQKDLLDKLYGKV